MKKWLGGTSLVSVGSLFFLGCLRVQYSLKHTEDNQGHGSFLKDLWSLPLEDYVGVGAACFALS